MHIHDCKNIVSLLSFIILQQLNGLVQDGRKTFSCIFFWLNRFVAFIVHTSIFCFRFSQKQSVD